MTAEPLRSAMTIGNVEDTSLALPSDNKLRTGQQRVLDQVHTIKRGKSKQWKSGSLSPSPTGVAPQGMTTFADFGTFKFAPSKANGTFSRSISNMSANFNKSVQAQKSRSQSTRTGRRQVNSASQWEQRFNSSTWPAAPNGLKPSRSDSNLAPPYAVAPTSALMRAQGQAAQSQQTLQSQSQSRLSRKNNYTMSNGNIHTVVTTQTRTTRPPSVHSQQDTKIVKTVTKTEQSAANEVVNMSDMTLREAVVYLSHPEENYQLCGASFIQHSTYKDDSAKQEVLALGGIPVLVALLRSPNADVSQSAAAALRNLVFKDQANKEEVQQCGGIGQALRLLKETDSTETQKQLTGLLWNMSSADNLKEELISTALPVLTESVVVPFTCWSDSSANNNIHPDVFYNATGCLRNLSSAKEKERQAMRECRGLIDSIMIYIQSCVAEDNPDDKSVENCACILHNLTYQLESESPECFEKYAPAPSPSAGKKSPTIGCFSPKSSKIQKENLFDVVDDGAPSGVNWLCHTKAMQTYLSLLGSSQKDATLEACCGALQNLTANKGQVCNVMSQTMVQKLGALQNITPLIHSPNPSLQKTAMSLVGNLSRTSVLQISMARHLLSDLVGLLSSGTKEMGNCDDTIATTCHAVRGLLPADPEVSKKVVNGELVDSLVDISENGTLPKGSKAAALLLYSLWNEKSLQGVLKKLGMAKSRFINEATTAAHKSVQVID